MQYQIRQDLESILAILEITQEEFASDIGVSRVTVNHWCMGDGSISAKNIQRIYDYAFQRGVRLNRIKAQLYTEDQIRAGDVLLFHGSKSGIEGHVDLLHNKRTNDFGAGFYCGESLEQSAMFVATYPASSLYMLKFNGKGLRKHVFHVDREWMLAVAYFRGRLADYRDTGVVKRLIRRISNVDYLIAPIADNRMFEIIDSFIDGEITDVQCQHCLSATDLGNQYVFTSKKAIERVTILEKCYLADAEKASYHASRREGFKVNQDKVRLAKKQYRNQGTYIEDILK